MIRSELIQKLAEENPELTLQEVEKIVDLFFQEIVDRLAAGGRVELRGFGAFTTRSRDARTGRNPRTKSEEHTSEIQSLMRISYAVFCLQNKKLHHDSRHI